MGVSMNAQHGVDNVVIQMVLYSNKKTEALQWHSPHRDNRHTYNSESCTNILSTGPKVTADHRTCK